MARRKRDRLGRKKIGKAPLRPSQIRHIIQMKRRKRREARIAADMKRLDESNALPILVKNNNNNIHLI